MLDNNARFETPLQFDFFAEHSRDRTPVHVEPHRHEFYEVYFFLSGNLTYVLGGRGYKLHAGDILLIGPGEEHRPRFEEGAQYYERIVFWINPRFLESLSAKGANLALCFETAGRPLSLSPQECAELRGLALSLAAPYNGFGGELLRRARFAEWMVRLNRLALVQKREQDAAPGVKSGTVMGEVARYLEEHLLEQISLDMLAERFFLTKYHLSREFKKHMGSTIHRYTLQKRLEMARELLKQDIPVAQVCTRCGFADYSNFLKSFKREYGMTPKEFRNMI